ncbi:MAG: hypothetical protein K0S09_629 [Sphingobacteriaceae bacterium]|nr:hypothetical protein [Sphingobacteriaceae bacterium]
MRDQSQEVNKFRSFRVDYFDKKTNWTDFSDLVTRPIENLFEITNDAVAFLYDQTSGNPFFTKVICEELLTLMINKRDSFISITEVREATNAAINNTGEQIFAHFWKDGIRDLLVNEEEIASNRRKMLIHLIDVLKKKGISPYDDIIDNAVLAGFQETSAISTLNEFIDRDVLILKDNKLDFKVAFFRDWLLNGGVDKLRTTLVESDRLDQEKLKEEGAKVTSQEIVDLARSWKTYRGAEITTDIVRSWLEQFGDNRNQRLMFKLLQHLHFYSDFEIKQKMDEIFQIIKKSFVKAGTVRTIKPDALTRKDILVSYLEDSVAKSGPEYAKLFADQNRINQRNVLAPERLERALSSNTEIHSIIFIDDYLGTGTSVTANLTKLIETFPNLFSNENIQFHLGVVCGFEEAKNVILTKMKRQKINFSVHICDLLTSSDKAFDESSKIFTIPAERHSARAKCYSIGSSLVKKNPLGFGDCQSLVVFPRTIPNNSLPILWAQSKTWTPLFERPVS